MKNSKIVTIVIVVIVLAVIGVLVFRHNPGVSNTAPVQSDQNATTTTAAATSPVETTSTAAPATARPGWKRYTDSEYGFTFEYPSAWNIETAFVKTNKGMSRIVSVASDVSRKLPIPERQEILSIRTIPATSTAIGGAVEYSIARNGFVSTTNSLACVTPAYKLGAAVVTTKLPVYQLMRAHTGDGIRTEDAVLTNKNTLVQISNVSSYRGNTDIAGVLSSFGFYGDTHAVVPDCKPATEMTAPANQNLIIQVTSPVTGTTWDSNTTHTVTWRTGSSPVTGNVGIYLVNRVNRRECLMATASAQAQSQTINVTAGQTCAQGGGMTLVAGEYDFYIKYPQNLVDPFATSTGALYASPSNQPIHLEIAE